jgi:Uma2 family endonuclease
MATALPAAHRFTRDEYHRMGTAQLFVGERVELLDGAVITMSPQSSAHAGTVQLVLQALQRALGALYSIRCQAPMVLGDDDEPEPDVAVCRPDEHAYRRAHPSARDVVLVVEVSDSSLAYDRVRKAARYAAAAIPNYWIVNLNERCVEVLGEPDPANARFRRREVVRDDAELKLPTGACLAAAEFLLQ